MIPFEVIDEGNGKAGARIARAPVEPLSSPYMNRGRGIGSFLFIGMSLYCLQIAFFYRSHDSVGAALGGLMTAGLVFAYLAYRRSIEGASWSDFGFVRPTPDDLLTGLLFGGASWAAAYVCAYAHLAPSARHSNLDMAGTTGPGALLALILMLAMLAFSEECLFRAYLIPRLEARRGTVTAVLLSSALFGAVHLYNFVPTALGGIVFSLAFLRRRSISASFIAHFVHNAIVLGSVYAEAQRALR